MADNSHIEWTDATWNPVTGCSIVSPGCTNCYAMKLAGTRLKHHPSRANLTTMTKAGPVWNGEVRFNEQWLTQPLEWKRPRMIFVCAHGDLFHESVPDDWIDKVFAVMALAPQHTFQVLTKRAARMREYVTNLSKSIGPIEREARAIGFTFNFRNIPLLPFPIRNVWLGVSTERQQEADERIPLLLQTPAAVRFISAEPLLGHIALHALNLCTPTPSDALRGWRCAPDDSADGYHNEPTNKLDWVIVGGESGRGARPMHPDWASDIRVWCQAVGVPFFFKQWGAFAPQSDKGEPDAYWASCGATFADHPVHQGYQFGRSELQRPRMMFHRSKGQNGRLLDGVEHNGMPVT